MWKDLSLKEKAAFMLVAVNNGIYDLQDILQHYNKFAEGGSTNPYNAGSLVDAIYKNFKEDEYLGKPSHNYDFTISEEEANRLGYYPDERGHRDDRVKKPAHPTHPSRGKWNSFEEFELTDKGMENPNYTLFGLNDGGQDPQAVMTYRGGVVLPEITVTPKKNYIHNPYDNINIYDEGGYVRETNNNPIAFDEEGNLVDLVTGEKGTMMLPEFTVRGVSLETRAKNYSSNFDGTYGLSLRDVYGMMPIIRDALDVKDIATDIYNGNYLNAGIGAGMFLLPNIIEKPLRKLSRVFKKSTKDAIESITNSNKFSITDLLWDAAYNKALLNNDLQEALRLRDLHFTAKAPNTVVLNDDGTPLKLYHGTDNNFNQFTFDLYGKTDNGGATFGKGIYTTPIKDYALLYGKNIKELYSNLTNPRDYGYVNPMEFIQLKMLFGEEFATGNGIDGVIGNPSWKGIKGLKEYVNHKPSALKYSDAITYDDNGKIIPLSKRDNFNNPDMRYSLLPIGLTIGGATYLNQRNKNE